MADELVIDLGDALASVERELADDPIGGRPAVIDAIALDATSSRLAVDMPGRVHVYSLADGTLDQYVLRDIAAHAPMRITFTTDGKHLVVGCGQLVSNTDSVFSVFAFATGKKKPVLGVPGVKALQQTDWTARPTTGVSHWALSLDGTRLVTAWDTQGLAVWNLGTRRRERLVIKAPSPDDDSDATEDAFAAEAVSLAPDGDRVAVLLPGALEVHPVSRGKRIARVEIEETFGTSRLAFTHDGIVWARCAPGACETSMIDIAAGTVARRPVALDKVIPLRIDATSVLWAQDVGEGDARMQILVRQDLVTGQLDPLARVPWPQDPHYPRIHVVLSPTGDRLARIDGTSVRVSSVG
jgi:hypothetical protein